MLSIDIKCPEKHSVIKKIKTTCIHKFMQIMQIPFQHTLMLFVVFLLTAFQQ